MMRRILQYPQSRCFSGARDIFSKRHYIGRKEPFVNHAIRCDRNTLSSYKFSTASHNTPTVFLSLDIRRHSSSSSSTSKRVESNQQSARNNNSGEENASSDSDSTLKDWFRFGCEALVAYCIIRTFTDDVVGVTLCLGPSMVPTLEEKGSLCFIDRFSYRFKDQEYQMGDVVISTCKTDPHKQVCKRILGCANDVIVYQRPSDFYPCTVVVPNGHVWLAGDNSQNSSDSRSYGPVPVGLLQGRVLLSIDQRLNVKFIPRKKPTEVAAEVELEQQRLREEEIRALGQSVQSIQVRENSKDDEKSDNSRQQQKNVSTRDDKDISEEVNTNENHQQRHLNHATPAPRRHSYPKVGTVRERPLLRPAMNISTDSFSPYEHTMIRRGISTRADLNPREKEELYFRVSRLAKDNQEQEMSNSWFGRNAMNPMQPHNGSFSSRGTTTAQKSDQTTSTSHAETS